MGNAIPVSGGSELESELTTRVLNLRSNQFIAVASPDVTAPAHCCVRQLASRRRPTRQFGAIGMPGPDRTAARPANRCLTELGMKLEPGFQIRLPTSPFRRPTSLCGQRLGRLGHANRTHLRQLSMLQSGQSAPARAGDERVQHRPAEAQATGLAWEPADHFGAPLDLL